MILSLILIIFIVLCCIDFKDDMIWSSILLLVCVFIFWFIPMDKSVIYKYGLYKTYNYVEGPIYLEDIHGDMSNVCLFKNNKNQCIQIDCSNINEKYFIDGNFNGKNAKVYYPSNKTSLYILFLYPYVCVEYSIR